MSGIPPPETYSFPNSKQLQKKPMLCKSADFPQYNNSENYAMLIQVPRSTPRMAAPIALNLNLVMSSTSVVKERTETYMGG
jgi:hypothetical protein